MGVFLRSAYVVRRLTVTILIIKRKEYMPHPRRHAWLFSLDAIECVEILGELRVRSVPSLDRWIPDDWLDLAIEIALTSQDSKRNFRYPPEEIAQQVWEYLKPKNTYLSTEE